jgi:phage terminase Nu1 subunit (DNA packaging protein)
MGLPQPELGRLIAFPASGREPWVTKRQVAGHFHVSEKTVERWVAAGMPCLRGRGRTVRFRVAECESWWGVSS